MARTTRSVEDAVLKWHKAKHRPPKPLTAEEVESRQLQRQANALLRQSTETRMQAVEKARTGHADPPESLVVDVAGFLIRHQTDKHTEPFTRTIKRARDAMRRAHYPGLERYGSIWVHTTNTMIERERAEKLRQPGTPSRTGKPDLSVPPAGVQAPRA